MTVSDNVKLASAYHNHVWPFRLTSGVMFFNGEKITIQEFERWASLFRRAANAGGK